MSEYTPTTEEIREYVETGGEPRPWVELDDTEKALEKARSEAFDRWLAAHDAEVRASVESDPAKDERLVRYMAMVTPLGYQSALSVVQQMTLMIRKAPSSIGDAWDDTTDEPTVCQCAHHNMKEETE